MKVCRECQQEKPLDQFYKHEKMKDGHLNKCIPCVKERVLKHRSENLEKIQAYDRIRGTFKHRRDSIKRYSLTERGKEVKKKSIKAYNERWPMKYAAKVITGNAIRDGILTRAESCEVCGSTDRIEGHHDDYTKPLEVRWLCCKCHVDWHKKNKPITE
jgi:hypothetical protein